MLANLEKALREKNITNRAFANYMGFTEKTLRNKLGEVTPFTYPEVRKAGELLSEYRIEYLFESKELEAV